MARRLAQLDKEPPKDPEITHLNLDEDYVYETVAEYLRNGTLPRSGGWDDQLVAWKEDYYKVLAQMAWESHISRPIDSNSMDVFDG